MIWLLVELIKKIKANKSMSLNKSENHVISEVVITALSQKISSINLRIPESLELFPGLVLSLTI